MAKTTRYSADLLIDLVHVIRGGSLTKAKAKDLERLIKAYFACHWRDDDSPQSEMTFGVRRAA